MKIFSNIIKILFLIICSFFISCDINSAYDNFEPENGIALVFFNYTEFEYTGYKFFIGAVKNNKFIATDSVEVKTIIWSINTAPSENLIKNNETGEQIARSYDGFTVGDSFPDGRWQPDYDKIKAISNEYTYKLRLSDGREQVFLKELQNFDEFTVGLNTFDIKKNAIIFRQ